ncbi:MAG: 5-formyltetrahydrofolate cyclo-ligase [Candidatus Alectryocaccobium sp.]|jgi:5-formyltetrahydrofolate cyclo-ligase
MISADKIDLKQKKAQIRGRMKELRRSAPDELVKNKSHMICERLTDSSFYKTAEIILIYNAVNKEVELNELIAAAVSDGKLIAYPVCTDKIHMEAYAPNSDSSFIKGSYGISEPDTQDSVIIEPGKIDLVIAPCTAFDEELRRLGMGAGYYDRYLKRCINAKIVAAAFEFQKVEEVPSGEFDIKMDAVVTESDVYMK